MDFAGFRSALQSAKQPSAYLGRRWKWINGTIIFGLVALMLYYLGVRPTETFSPIRQVDFQYWYQIPPLIFQKLEYPSLVPQGWHEHLSSWHVNYSYLPSAVALMLPLYAFPRPAAFGIWLCLQGFAFFAVLLLSMRLAGLTLWPSRWLIVASAVLLAENPISWDLRNHNVNLIYLGLVLAGVANRSSSIGGGLLALSFNLKLYSASFFAGLAWWRDYRRLVSMLICSLVIGLVPSFLVGTSGFLTLMKEWMGQVAFTMTEAGDAMAPMSLRRGLAAMLSADVSSSTVYWLWRASQAMWILIVLSYFIFLPRRRHDDTGQDPQRFADTCVLLLAPLPLSTWLVPYHAVVLLPAYVLLLSVVANAAWPTPVRGIALAGSTAYLILQVIFPSWDVRSVSVYLSLALVVSALAAMRVANPRSEPAAMISESELPILSSRPIG